MKIIRSAAILSFRCAPSCSIFFLLSPLSYISSSHPPRGVEYRLIERGNLFPIVFFFFFQPSFIIMNKCSKRGPNPISHGSSRSLRTCRPEGATYTEQKFGRQRFLCCTQTVTDEITRKWNAGQKVTKKQRNQKTKQEILAPDGFPLPVDADAPTDRGRHVHLGTRDFPRVDTVNESLEVPFHSSRNEDEWFQGPWNFPSLFFAPSFSDFIVGSNKEMCRSNVLLSLMEHVVC